MMNGDGGWQCELFVFCVAFGLQIVDDVTNEIKILKKKTYEQNSKTIRE